MQIHEMQAIIEDILSQEGMTPASELEFSFGKSSEQRFLTPTGYGVAQAMQEGGTLQGVMYIELFLPEKAAAQNLLDLPVEGHA